MTTGNLVQDITTTLGDTSDRFDVEAIAEELRREYGPVGIDAIPSDEYWAIVRKHDADATTDTETWTAYLTTGDHHTHPNKIVVVIFQSGPFREDAEIETTIEVADYVMAPGSGADILGRWEGWAESADRLLAEAGWSHVHTEHWVYCQPKAIAEAVVRRSAA